MSHKKIQLHTSRLMALLLCLSLIFACAPAARAAEGTCGDSLEWSFDGSTLTITGSGVMDNYTESSPAPWYAYRSEILSLSLPDGLTRIGSRAFAECTGLSVVNIPGSVQIIDEAAFLGCSGMTMLTLNEGLRTIGVCAFEQCESLADLRLPNSLINLEDHAFYMCKGLSYVTIPGAVRTIGSGVFAYCKNLIRADINASVTMPSWSFYGCDKLEVVTIQGESVDPESLKISTPPQGIPGYGSSDSGDGEYESSGEEPEPTTAPEPDTDASSGEQAVDRTVVTKTDNSTTVSTTKTPADQQGSATTEITSTIQNDKGWQDVIDKVNSATIGGNSEPVDVTVYIPNSDTVSADVLNKFAGKNVTLNIQTQSGSQFTLDCNKLEDIKEDLVLSYTLTPAVDVPEELAGCTVYKLNFHASAQLPTEIIIRLPGGHAFSTATLYQIADSDLEQLQSVLVDASGDSHWYLSTIDQKTDYLIGIDVPGAVEDSPIIPAELHDVYKVANVYDGVEYVVTGRTSSWGMNLGQVMGILAVVMISVIVVVGVVMYIWNKRRLKNGYVPDWDDEDE